MFPSDQGITRPLGRYELPMDRQVNFALMYPARWRKIHVSAKRRVPQQCLQKRHIFTLPYHRNPEICLLDKIPWDLYSTPSRNRPASLPENGLNSASLTALSGNEDKERLSDSFEGPGFFRYDHGFENSGVVQNHAPQFFRCGVGQ